jgi:hypothetical protein
MKSRGRFEWDSGFFLERTDVERVRAPRPSSAGSVTIPSTVNFDVGSIRAVWQKNFGLDVSSQHISESWANMQAWERRR